MNKHYFMITLISMSLNLAAYTIKIRNNTGYAINCGVEKYADFGKTFCSKKLHESIAFIENGKIGKIDTGACCPQDFYAFIELGNYRSIPLYKHLGTLPCYDIDLEVTKDEIKIK